MDAGKTDSCQRGGVGHWVKEDGRNNRRPSGDSQRERGWGQAEVGRGEETGTEGHHARGDGHTVQCTEGVWLSWAPGTCAQGNSIKKYKVK